MNKVRVAITAASYSGNKGAAAMLQSSVSQLFKRYGQDLEIFLMSVYPTEDIKQVPWDFVRVIPASPQKLLFAAFPLAVLHRLFSGIRPMRNLLEKNRILNAYAHTDFVLDEAGISFVDSRGFIMNTYAFVCAAVPLLMGVPTAKYSQAMGPFQDPWNRFLAKWILPKLSFICARGEITRDHLAHLGCLDMDPPAAGTERIKKREKGQVYLCADGAFTMPEDEKWIRWADRLAETDPFFAEYSGRSGDGKKENRLVGISISTVVEKKSKKQGINYEEIMVSFIEELNRRGYPVLLLANAAREGTDRLHNNDLPLGDRIYRKLEDPSMCRWFREEMPPEKIRALTGLCRYVAASRFHAMIGALYEEIPVFLVGWSHKYQEVLDFFGLGKYAIDYASLSLEELTAGFERIVREEAEIRRQIHRFLPEVKESSRKNIILACDRIDAIKRKKHSK